MKLGTVFPFALSYATPAEKRMIFALRLAQNQVNLIAGETADEVLLRPHDVKEFGRSEDLLSACTQAYGWLKSADEEYRENVYSGSPRSAETEELHSSLEKALFQAMKALSPMAEKLASSEDVLLQQFRNTMDALREAMEERAWLAKGAERLRSIRQE